MACTEEVPTRPEFREDLSKLFGPKKVSGSTKESQWMTGGHLSFRLQQDFTIIAVEEEKKKKKGQLCREFCVHRPLSNGGLAYQQIGTQDSQQPSLVDLLQVCGRERNLVKGFAFHALLLKGGSPMDIYVGTALLCMYAECGALAKAQEVFDELPTRDVAAWNAIISAYSRHELGIAALNLFECMRDEGYLPDVITFICILKACASVGAIEKGEEVHAEVRRQGLLKRNHVLGTALVDMYGKCGMLAKAQEVFDELPLHDIASWNALIAGYAQNGFSIKALNCYVQMCKEDLSPNAATFACVLKACGTIRAVDLGDEIHAQVRKQGLLERNVVLGTAMVDMYAKCGVLTKAHEVFNELTEKDVASWNALIYGYARSELEVEALDLFGKMRDEGVSPDTVTFLCMLKVCGSIGASEKGKEIHVEVSKLRLLAKSVELSNTLVDMYAKCGLLSKAQEVFDGLLAQTIVSWNVLLAGYAQFGKAERAFGLMNKLVENHIDPNEITFGVLLTACSHAGLVDEGQFYFNLMSSKYGIIPNLDHHACMIDLFSRAGQFEKALSMINEVQTSDHLTLCSVMLGAC